MLAPSSHAQTSSNSLMNDPASIVRCQRWGQNGRSDESSRSVPEETAIALTYNGGTYAVMMATPLDLDDFALGFSLNEGIVDSCDDIQSLDVLSADDGIELRIWLDKSNADRLQRRRRHIAGPTGCGLCGIESIAEATRPARAVGPGKRFSSAQIMAAMASLSGFQKLNMETRAVHAAALWEPARGIVALREDVGRHNALDKLVGASTRASVPAREGAILLTSRVSVEMVQKSATVGASVMVSVSAPTATAVRMAEAAGITLAAVARRDGFEVFTHPSRIASEAL
ncbi:MAG: FdhD protein [Bradyrhizobium sp.]|nr:FdhD protein [Bradyrhizobium sp.]